MHIHIDLSAIAKKVRAVVLVAAGFTASVAMSIPSYFEQTKELPAIVAEEAQQAGEKLNAATDVVNEHIQKGVEKAKQATKPVKKAVQKAAKKVDEFGCKIGSAKDPRCAPPLVVAPPPLPEPKPLQARQAPPEPARPKTNFGARELK